MTGKPLPNVYDDTVLDRDLKGTPDPVVQEQASLPHGDDVFRAEEHDHGDLTSGKTNDCCGQEDPCCQTDPDVRIQKMTFNIGGGAHLAAMLDSLVTALISGQVHGLDDDEITLEDVVEKFQGDVSAAMSVLCRGDASSIQVNRTLRDGVNPKRKLVVKFSAEMQEVYDEDDDGQDTDDFQ